MVQTEGTTHNKIMNNGKCGISVLAYIKGKMSRSELASWTTVLT